MYLYMVVVPSLYKKGDSYSRNVPCKPRNKIQVEFCSLNKFLPAPMVVELESCLLDSYSLVLHW